MEKYRSGWRNEGESGWRNEALKESFGWRNKSKDDVDGEANEQIKYSVYGDKGETRG